MPATPSKAPTATRRSMIRAAAAAFGGLAMAGVAAMLLPAPAKVQAANLGDRICGMGVRKEANDLTANSADVAICRKTVAWMKARPDENGLDPLGWAQHWAHQSLFCATNTFQFQIHYGWSSLANLEQKIRRVAQEPAFALPFYDWTRNPVPPAWIWGDDNPLHNKTRLQEAGDVIPADFLELGPALRAKRFDHFGGRKRAPGDLQIKGAMEQGAHNNVHNWMGGEMASFDSAGDDAFFQLHHGQIDRIWDIWMGLGEGRANPTDADWLDHSFWFYGYSGAPEMGHMRDLLTTEAQGYRYADLNWRHTLTGENTPKLADYAAAAGRKYGAIELTEEKRAALKAIRRDGGPGRATLTYERLSAPIHPYEHRLFLVDAATDEATYVGAFAILPIPDLNQGLERQVSSQVEVPEAALDKLIVSDRVYVVGVGVPLKGRAIADRPIPFDGVSLSIEA